MSPTRHSWLQELTPEECTALLQRPNSLGRVAYVVDGVPVIVPVNFVLDDDVIVFLTTRGSKLSWLSNHSHVAFEVDEAHSADESGWSVLIRGTAREVADAAQLRRLRRGSLHSWAVEEEEHWVAVTLDHVSGRRIRHGARPDDGGSARAV